MSKALLIIDCQVDFCPGGSLPVPGGDEVCTRISEFKAAHEYEHVIASKDRHSVDTEGHFSDTPDFIDTWPQHCMAGTDGADFHPNLNVKGLGPTFYKGFVSAAYSAFDGWNVAGISLIAYLKAKDIDEVDVCGIEWNHCVRATVLDACLLGLRVNVLTELCAYLPGDDLIHATREEMIHAGANLI